MGEWASTVGLLGSGKSMSVGRTNGSNLPLNFGVRIGISIADGADVFYSSSPESLVYAGMAS